MKRKKAYGGVCVLGRAISAPLLGILLLVSGCEEKTAQGRKAAAAPKQSPAKPSPSGGAANDSGGGDRLALIEDDPDLEVLHLARPAPVRPVLFRYWGTGLADPVEVALDEANAAFDRGKSLYENGQAEEARAEFDQAVDQLLEVGLPLRDDPRLLYGFESLVDRIQSLEMAGMAEASAAEDTPVFPAPIEEIPLLSQTPTAELRAQAEQEMQSMSFDLPLTLNDPVLRVLDFFQTERGRRIVENGLRRAGRYRDLIHQILEEEGLPRDLIFVAQAESGFQPHARSRMRAVGLWQFMSYRGREYGLEVNWWVDERRDPVKATRAAARHLRDLYELFGDWHLALAAYNGGPGTVSRAVERTGYADYWEMVRRRVLPRETSSFVPIILAVALVAKNPAKYGIAIEPDAPLRFEAVPVSKPIDLRKVAEVIGVDLEVLLDLNPHVLRRITPKQEGFVLYLPVGTGATLLAELPRIPEAERVYWERHRVRRGETLSHISARYGISAHAIAEANGISLRSLIHPGDVLLIPGGGAMPVGRRPSRRAVANESARRGEAHMVRQGETLWGLAQQYGITVKALEQANPFLADRELRAGDRLHIPD